MLVLEPRAATLLVMTVILLSVLSSPTHIASAFTIGQSASVVIGQSSFNGWGSYTTQNGLNGPEGVALDSSGNLWVSDGSNNRILKFTSPFSNGMNAALVIGQSSFTTKANATNQHGLNGPWDLKFDGKGNLWVADEFNNRVLEFTAPFATGMSASLVLGQSGFTTSAGVAITTSSSMYRPEYLAFDASGDLWVADEGNNRVLEFIPPFSSGMSASLVIGQSAFTTYGSATTSGGLNDLSGLAFDTSGNLWVADELNNRTVRFSSPFSNGMSASLVLGQPGFTSGTAAMTQNGLCKPEGIAFDSSGNLWVADGCNYRTLEFSPPFSNGLSASLVLGQPGFTTNAYYGTTTSSSMAFPGSVAFDSSGNIWVDDLSNNRILMFPSTAPTTTTTTSTSSGATTTTSTTTVTSTAPATTTTTTVTSTLPVTTTATSLVTSTTTATAIASVTTTQTTTTTSTATITLPAATTTTTSTLPVTTTQTTTTTTTTTSTTTATPEITGALSSLALPLTAAIVLIGSALLLRMRKP